LTNIPEKEGAGHLVTEIDICLDRHPAVGDEEPVRLILARLISTYSLSHNTIQSNGSQRNRLEEVAGGATGQLPLRAILC
jgi:hypothetical protein